MQAAATHARAQCAIFGEFLRARRACLKVPLEFQGAFQSKFVVQIAVKRGSRFVATHLKPPFLGLFSCRQRIVAATAVALEPAVTLPYPPGRRSSRRFPGTKALRVRAAQSPHETRPAILVRHGAATQCRCFARAMPRALAIRPPACEPARRIPSFPPAFFAVPDANSTCSARWSAARRGHLRRENHRMRETPAEKRLARGLPRLRERGQ